MKCLLNPTDTKGRGTCSIRRTAAFALFLLQTFPLFSPIIEPAAAAPAAEERSRARSEPLSLQGLRPEEVIRRLGQPDQRELSEDQERWIYGQSIVFFTGGVVTAWSDQGDFQPRLIVRSLQKNESGDPADQDGWETAWRRQKPVAPEDVVDEILEPEKSAQPQSEE
jgi:hypothetical protein